MDVHKTVSLSEQVFQRLEMDILTGVYPIGEIVTESTLVENLGVSRTPIREAILRLNQEGLVKNTPKGIEIVGITQKDVEDIFEIRYLIEGLSARKCAEIITDEQLKELKDVLDLQAFYVEKADAEHIRIQDTMFHQLIYSYCGSSTLYETLEQLHRKVQKYRTASVSTSDRALQSVHEHETIYEALAKHDATQAEATMKTHVLNAKTRILGGR